PVENDFYDVLRLQSHFEDWDDEDQKDWNKQSQIVLSLLELAGLTEMASEPGAPLHALTSLDVKRLISALESNAFGMFDRTKKKPVCFGRAIYPIASFFNHSCEYPYDSRVGEFRMMTFFSICEIPKGKDITISYIDTEMPLQARRLALLSDYHFHCCCERCLRE
ncbi:MAG: hypothetical protein JOS17DRAFT_670337, partial [Linnemannia elongata]